MGHLAARRVDGGQCWARLRLDNGDSVFVSMAAAGVKVMKMKWGVLPVRTLWSGPGPLQRARIISDLQGPMVEQLDDIVARIIDCGSAEDVAQTLQRGRRPE